MIFNILPPFQFKVNAKIYSAYSVNHHVTISSNHSLTHFPETPSCYKRTEIICEFRMMSYELWLFFFCWAWSRYCMVLLLADFQGLSGRANKLHEFTYTECCFKGWRSKQHLYTDSPNKNPKRINTSVRFQARSLSPFTFHMNAASTEDYCKQTRREESNMLPIFYVWIFVTLNITRLLLWPFVSVMRIFDNLCISPPLALSIMRLGKICGNLSIDKLTQVPVRMRITRSMFWRMLWKHKEEMKAETPPLNFVMLKRKCS